MMRTQKYNISVQYRPGKRIPVVDTLFRRSLKSTDAPCEAFDRHVQSIMSHLLVSAKDREEVRTTTNQDELMSQLKKTILEGWPERRSQCRNEIKEFGTTETDCQLMRTLS